MSDTTPQRDEAKLCQDCGDPVFGGATYHGAITCIAALRAHRQADRARLEQVERELAVVKEDARATCLKWYDAVHDRDAAREALRWLLHLHRGIGKGGAAPEPGEWEEALAAAEQAISSDPAEPSST